MRSRCSGRCSSSACCWRRRRRSSVSARLDQGTQPTEQTARRVRPARRGLRAGLQRPDPDRRRQRRRRGTAAGLRRRAGPRGVASASEPQFNDSKSVAIVFVTPDSAPQDVETEELVDRLRSDVVPTATEGGDAVAYVSGLTAAFADIADRIYERLPLFLLYIIGVTFIVLAMVFRSIVISLRRRSPRSCPPLSGSGYSRSSSRRATSWSSPASTDGPDRDVRPADRLRDPLRALDGLHGVPHEPHSRGARPRAEDEEAVEHGIAAIGRVVVAAAIIMGPSSRRSSSRRTASRRSSASCWRSRF